MSHVGILAFGAVSALGEGRDAIDAGTPGEAARVAIGHDAELAAAGLARPHAARARVPPGTDDRATWLLRRALELCLGGLDGVRPFWRAERVGLVVGTSSGGMRGAEVAFGRMARAEPCVDPEGATYHGPVARVARESGLRLDPVMVVLGACASSVLSIGLASRWLSRGECDVVLAGGFDDVTVFVAAGFEALRATTASPPPRPFRVGRDGMALGEGAGVVALARVRPRERARAFVTGFGAASDAVHLTAPDREGKALARAVAAALEEAGRPHIDLVSPHATATPFNDPVEARVLAAALGAATDSGAPVVAPFKAQIGHTLGAAGVLETLMCVDALERGVLPAAAGHGEIDSAAQVRLLERAEAGSPRSALKMACAFGGANAALVLQSSPGASTPRTARPSFVSSAVHVGAELPAAKLLAAIGDGVTTLDRIDRSDALVRLALAAVAALRSTGAQLSGAGIVVGTALATLETNAVYGARIRERGACMAEPRRFPYTSPNAVAGECSIAFGLTGPGFSVGGGLHAGLEALAAAALLVEGGDAERVVVVAVDDAGPATRALGYAGLCTGAVATLLSADGRGALARVGAMTLARAGVAAAAHAPGHLSLLPLVWATTPPAGGARRAACPCLLESSSPPDAMARIVLEPV